MKLVFNNLTLSEQGFLALPSGPALSLAPGQLKAWWQEISDETREEICKFDDPYIVSMVAEIANSALLVCKLHLNYKKKDLISCKKCKTEGEERVTHTFEINLEDKDIIDHDLATLFSCFYIQVIRDQGSTMQGNHLANSQGSHIGVKKEKLHVLLDYLEKSLNHFGVGEKLLFRREDILEGYPSLINQASQQLFTAQKLPSDFKKLLEHLAAFSFILEHLISVTFEREQALYLSSVMAMLAMRKNKSIDTAQLPRPESEQAVEENSTASVSPSNFVVALDVAQNINLEELNQKLLQKTTPMVNHAALSNVDSAEEIKYMPEDMMYPDLKRNNSYYSYENSNDLYMNNNGINMYQGFQVGDLDITFDPVDNMMVEDEEEEPRSEEEARYVDDSYYYGEQSDSEENAPEEEQPKEESQQPYYPSYYNMPLNNGMMPSLQYNSQSYNVEFYSTNQYVQQPQQPQDNMMMPNNYGQYMTPQMNRTPSYYNDYQRDYDDQSMRERSFESHSSYSSDRTSYYSNSTYGGSNYYNKGGYDGGQFSNNNGRERRYDAKPKLPPRFQRKKEGVWRNQG